MPYLGPFVCVGCIDEPGIQDFIENNKIDEECSYCKSQGIPVARLDEVTGHMKLCIEYEYDDVNEWAVYDRESGYRVKTWDAWDLLTDEFQIDFPNSQDLELLKDIISRLPDITWCERDPLDVTDQEKVRYDWAWFSEVVMHHRRFLFDDYGDPEDDNLSPGELLEKIFKFAEFYELFGSLSSGTQLFRARFQAPDVRHTTAQDLGPPPKERAIQSNRMSPAGIPMFYACDIPETALRETADREGRFAVGLFTTGRSALILDLTKVPSTPSLFQTQSDTLEFQPREVLGFLNHLANEISRPIERDDKVHFSYTPTQVVTEFVLNKLARKDASIGGIKFNSAVHPKHASYVIFGSQENLLPAPKRSRTCDTNRWLELVFVSEYDVTPRDIEQWEREIPKRYERDYRQLLYVDE